MRIILAPAKKMNADTDSLPWRDLPAMLPRTRILLEALRRMTPAELQKLWKCNDSIARLNVQRLMDMDLERRLTPAIFAYEGIAFQYMAPDVFSQKEFDYVQEHLRILSGFYGVLRPFDGVTEYRLEMQAKLEAGGAKDLYGFWGSSIAENLLSETDCIVNLASQEYSRSVQKYLHGNVRFITCVFGEKKGGKIIEKATACKMARGEMVRYMAENGVREPEDIRCFDRLGYRFSPADSDGRTYVFLKE